MRDVTPPATAPPGAALGAVLLAAGLAATFALAPAPAATARREAETALREAVGCPVVFEKARYRPGDGIVVTGGHLGTPAEPLRAGGTADAATESVEVRNVLVRLPGGAWMAHAFGRLWRDESGAAFDLTGAFTGFGMRVTRCRVRVRGGGRSLRIDRAGLCTAAPGGLAMGAAGVRVDLRGLGDPIAGWRGRVTADRFHLRGVPGTALQAELEVRHDGAWEVREARGRLCAGTLEGRAVHRPGDPDRRLELEARVRDARLDRIPPGATAGANGLDGLAQGTLTLAVDRGGLRGALRVTGRGVELGAAPAFLQVLRTLQFRLSSSMRFTSLDLAAKLEPSGLALERLDLPGPALTLRLAGPGRVGWNGALDLPLEVRGNRGVFGELPVVGNVLKSKTPIIVDVQLGGTLAEPEGVAGAPRNAGD